MSNNPELDQYLLEWATTHPAIDPHALFSLYIRIARQKNQITREELSRQTQISVATLIALENGLLTQADLPPALIPTLESALHLSYENFISQYRAYLAHHSSNH